MKIEAVRATPVRVPRLARFLPRTAHGEVSASEYVILELSTDDGLHGLGEVTCSPTWNGENAAGSIALLETELHDLLIGSDPTDWATLAAALDPVIGDRPFLRAAIEMACLDLSGKLLGVPVAELIGGAVRRQIPTKLVLPARPPATVVDMALDAVGLGASTLKVKVGVNLQEDLERVSVVRGAVGDGVRLTVDANEGWNEDEARAALPALAELQVAAIEQPLPRTANRQSALLREITSAAIVGDESIWILKDVLGAQKEGSFDTVSIYPGKCGGLRRCLQLARVALKLGMEVSFGSNLEMGIGAAALAHAAAACPSLSEAMPADLIGPLYFESALLQDAGFTGWAGATLPPGPGLGVELDPAAVAHYAL